MRELPQIHFEDSPGLIWSNEVGAITGYSRKVVIPRYKCLEAYHFQNIVILGATVPEEDKTILTLQKLGYHVPSRRMNLNPLATKEDIIPYTRPEEILWDELRTGKGQKLIQQELEGLLIPILSAVGSAQKVEFSIYNPFVVETTDDVIPPYIEYDELFSLPTTSNGIVDLSVLLERIKTMPSDRALAISSNLETKTGHRHLPMIDFSTGYERESWDASSVLQRVGVPEECLVDSGNSYHHYDVRELLTTEQFWSYLELIAKQPEIGENWPWFSAHQGFSLLRISPCGLKPHFPSVLNPD
jgi:hypothetical protein